MRRAASALLYRASCLGFILTLSCSDGGGRADIFGSPAPYMAPGPGSGGATQMGAGGEPVPDQPASGNAGQGGTIDFGSETSNGAGGQGGSSGAGGVSQAGGGGSAGKGGGGTSAENGGSAGGLTSAGSAGTTGGGVSSSGSSGSGPVSSAPNACAEACTTTQDCRIGNQDAGFTCNPSTSRCEMPGTVCQTSLECLPGSSFWFLDCNSDADCFYFDDDACVSVAGAGKCARLAPGASVEASGCELPTADAVTLPRFGGGGSVVVCADGGRRCEHGACVGSCRSHLDCSPARNGSVCDLTTGACRCERDQDCGGLGVSHCNVASGRCECARDTDCEELPGRDVCVEGQCACSSVSACNEERLFAGTKLVCE